MLFIAVALGCFALLRAPNAFGVSPPPDGGYVGNNTAEGTQALFSLTSGIDNTGLGFQALYRNNTGNFNTAEGFRSLFNNISGSNNTANGVQALFNNTTGVYNTALGVNTLYRNTGGVENTAVGVQASFNNNHGVYNTALGVNALYSNTIGSRNTATGWQALFHLNPGVANTATGSQALYNTLFGDNNTANGDQALVSNTFGSRNTATGSQALYHNNGDLNIALGFRAGSNLTTGRYNIDIGSSGIAAETNTIRIGTVGTQQATYIAGISGQTATGGAAVFVASNGKLGTVTSSRRFKKDIADMDAASEALLALRPVTFRYKPELDEAGIPQYGLVAEEVAEVNPDLVVRDENGEIYTVRYEAVNAMLLNEFLKEHRKVEKLTKDFRATVAQQQKEIQALTARLEEQASQIQKVSDQLAAASPSHGGLEVTKGAPQVALNNQ